MLMMGEKEQIGSFLQRHDEHLIKDHTRPWKGLTVWKDRNDLQLATE